LPKEKTSPPLVKGEAAIPTRRIDLDQIVSALSRLSGQPPLKRAVQPIGSIVAIPVLGGLHHQYVRI
jgi:hypothetical protein